MRSFDSGVVILSEAKDLLLAFLALRQDIAIIAA